MQLLFGLLAFGNIAGEATRVDEPAFLPEDIGADQHVADGAVLAAELGLVFAERLPGSQPAEDVDGHFGVGMELGDGVADVLLVGAAQHV